MAAPSNISFQGVWPTNKFQICFQVNKIFLSNKVTICEFDIVEIVYLWPKSYYSMFWLSNNTGAFLCTTILAYLHCLEHTNIG